MSFLDERSEDDFLVYANSVIKSRAIPNAEDNLKPIHRKILYTMLEQKVTPDKPTRKCQTIAGAALMYSPHGDASVYGAMVRMSQWWKLRYPLIEMQGNCGNLLGDGPAASRYTECRLTPVGMMMLEDLNKNCVEFKPNYTEETTEPVTLPSKFPYLLCGNNSGIAVGMSSDLVSHNFTEVSEAIKYYLEHKDCTVSDLMQFIKGPDFPTGGKIINGEELLNAYQTGRGSVRVQAHYDVLKKGAKTILVFHDIPYGVELEPGVKEPLKKLVIEEGYDAFEDINITKAGPHNFDITITLSKNADVAKCLNILFSKTRLASTIKINQTLIVNGEPKLLNLKDLIAYWVNYRSDIIKRIAENDYAKTNHKLTVVIGLKKCMSDIDKLITLIRNSDSRADAKVKIMNEFVLNDEQADAVLDMKLSRLSRLDLTELDDNEKNLTSQIAELKRLIDEEELRYNQIRKDLDEIKRVLGKDERLTEINYARPVENGNGEDIAPLIKKEYLIYKDGVVCVDDQITMGGNKSIQNNLLNVLFAYNKEDIFGFTAEGDNINLSKNAMSIKGAFVKDDKKTKVVSVTKGGNIKISKVSEYKWGKSEKTMKIKDGDELMFVGMCDDNDYIILYNGENHVLKLAIKDLVTAGKNTIGVKSGFTHVESAIIAADSDVILCCTKDGKAKFTSVKDFNIDSRGNKGQQLAENTAFVRGFDPAREQIYVIPKQGKTILLDRNKISVKSRTAVGASVTSRLLANIF